MPEAMPRPLIPALIGIAIVGTAMLGLRSAEQWVLFPAPPGEAEAPPVKGELRHEWLESGDSRSEAFLLLPEPAPATPAPLIVYAHGNGEQIDYWLSGFEQVRALGVAVLLVEYPGYGRSTGTPSEDSIQRALAAGYDWAAAQPEIDKQRVIGYGTSLGGGAICALGRIRPLSALVLESTFTSVPDLIAERPAPVAMLRHLVRNRFDNLEFVRRYDGPMLVMHGDRDEMIPLAQGQKLARAARLAEFRIQRCGHNDCPASWDAVLKFLGKHGLLRQTPPVPAPSGG